MVRAIVFDLDDTLYEEITYVRGGFRIVGEVLAARGVGDAAHIAAALEQLHIENGRAGVLQTLAERLAFPVAWIPELVTTIRSHRPDIRLAADADEVLPRLRTAFRLGCVTDGWAAVQRGKVDALGLRERLDAIVIADERGREYWKPHPVPFLQCCELLQADPGDTVFVGDNPDRDLLGARRAGLRSIRIRRPGSYFCDATCSDADVRPDAEIVDLRELEERIRDWR